MVYELCNSCNTSGSVLVVGYTSTLAQLLTRLNPELKIKPASYSHYVIWRTNVVLTADCNPLHKFVTALN